MKKSGGKGLRIDEILVRRGYAESRSKAKAMILAGEVYTASQRVEKPGTVFPPEVGLRLKQRPRLVGRGGEKLEGFLQETGIPVRGMPFLDIGASTGGFTDALLQRGAGPATCLDVGRNQLHPKLRGDSRVTNLEKLNARTVTAGQLPRKDYPLVVVDLSFISLRLVLPNIWKFLEPGGLMICLVKPQFEATREEADEGKGIIRDDGIRNRILREIGQFAESQLPGCKIFHKMESPLSGTDGNREFLLGLEKSPSIFQEGESDTNEKEL